MGGEAGVASEAYKTVRAIRSLPPCKRQTLRTIKTLSRQWQGRRWGVGGGLPDSVSYKKSFSMQVSNSQDH